MPEIQNSNYVYPQQIQQMPPQNMNPYMNPSLALKPELSLRDEFVKQHKKNGLFERLYNGIKNLTGLGIGSKKLQQEITKAENGELDEEKVRADIDKYRKSQVNSAQAFGDLMSVGASGISFFFIRNKLKMKNAEMTLNAKFYDKIAEGIKETGKETKHSFLGNVGEQIIKTGKSKGRLAVICAAAAGIVGGLTKYWTLKFNRIGSDEFKYSKKDFNGAKTPYDKAAYKLEKKTKSSERRAANFRNFASGAINGLMMPITLLGGAIAGIPLYLAGNSLNRYFVGNHEEKNKTFTSYIDNLKNDGITHGVLAAAVAAPMIRKAHYTNVFDINLKKATDKLLDVTLKESGFEGKTTYQELDNILMGSENIKKILENKSIDMDEKIRKLTEENIFAVKFEQIADRGDLSVALKENCPATRTLEEAQKFISENLGSGYEVSKCLGVGTVAETYLAKGPDGKEVCLKVLKEGISKEKIQADKEKFINIIKGLEGKSQEEKDYLIRNIEDLSNGIENEVNFQNELEAAKKLMKNTKVAKVVKPIEVKNGIYIMEKADGISLDALIKINSHRYWLDYYQSQVKKFEAGKLDKWDEALISNNNLSREEFIQRHIENYKKEIQGHKDEISKIEARTPQFGNIDMSDADAKYLFEEYMKVMVEQFYKVDKAGKTLHADIHPGNIFIDINAMRAKKGQIFTLIDTGNTIDLSAKQAMDSLRLTTYIKQADVPDIVEYMLEGAHLEGSGLTKEMAAEKITADLKKCFFDNETALREVNTSSLFTLVSNIMKKHNIIPGSNQLNLDKARTSADTSLKSLLRIWFDQKDKVISSKTSITDKTASAVNTAKEYVLMMKKYDSMKAKQEKKNLLQLSPQEALRYKKNPNLLKTNDEDYLTYKLKQKIKDSSKISDEEK